ncbi:increased DNA methylation 2-like isoform X2 [Telopea speciosissima]|uniref:increased DNA methylation 2-like isoform X1 n=1 Tax=Telopea speciosissima TaxID=54955 RepID=UPI001CC6B343|nr:increased DNA methylation 2-like isoform X1 [Telopea speciosissima]XP_043724367.1 increased DNA methylation 2-like isoform X2 [Telopea speciosissima]
MESLFEAAESLSSMAFQSSDVPSYMTTTDDQHFLLLFIMGTYFGPDIKADKPKKSALQRMAEQLPPYTSDQLAGSQIKTVEVERIYYYVLRKADQSVVVRLPLLQQFFQGNLFISAGDTRTDSLQFPDLFPGHLHPHSRYKNRYKVIENIVFINDPEISYIKPDDVERFKRLTGLEDLLLDRDAARSLSGVHVAGHIDSTVVLQEFNEGSSLRRSSRNSQKRQRGNGHPELEETLSPLHNVEIFNSIPFSTPLPSSSGASFPTEVKARLGGSVGPAMIFLPSHPSMEEWNNIVAATKNGIALTGSAAERQAGPLIGLVDIGVCDDAYLFRISLPGVRKVEREFSCEVEADGQVLIKGVTTTGEKLVFKDTQVFEMQTQYLCPSGSFSVSFKLPGPVEPREFSGNFGADGILEGIVMKERSQTQRL